jgi:hypothetical protein
MAFGHLPQLSYFETSALGGDSIQEAFHRTAAAVLRRIKSDPHDGIPVYDSPLRRPIPTRCHC